VYDAGLLAGSLLGRDTSRIPDTRQKRVVAINVCAVGASNAIYLEHETNSEYHERIRIEMAALCNDLIDQGYHILFYHMDPGDLFRIQRVFTLIRQKQNCTIFEGSMSFEEILAVCERAQFTISNRLHSAILSMSVGTPTLHLMYAYKCYNFMESVDLRHCGLFTNSFSSIGVQHMIPYILSTRSKITAVVAKARLNYHHMFKKIIGALHLPRTANCTFI